VVSVLKSKFAKTGGFQQSGSFKVIPHQTGDWSGQGLHRKKSDKVYEKIKFVGLFELRKNATDPRNPGNSINRNLCAECLKKRF